LPLLRNRLQFWSCPACSIVILGTKLDKSWQLPYFPAHKMQFFSQKMWLKFDLRFLRWGYVLFPNL
jgi:hypothetical protein